MANDAFVCQCIYDILDGLRDGLSHYSQPSRVALLYAIGQNDPIRIFDPQSLLRDHEPKFRELFIESDGWRRKTPPVCRLDSFGLLHVEKNLQLAGLISWGGRSHSVFYQMWFTEHHPDMCHIGPTERWLEQAAWRLTHDLANPNALYSGISGFFLREYTTHAVRDYIVDEMNLRLGWDSQLRVYPILDAVLGISRTPEEGAWPRGKIVFVEPASVASVKLLTRFREFERPRLEHFKHVRKLLQAVEHSDRRLVSDGASIVGITDGQPDVFHLVADFRAGHGFLNLGSVPICSFSDGNFHSFTHLAKLVQVEEALLESDLDSEISTALFRIVSQLVHAAETKKYGCTLVIDLNETPVEISGHHLEETLDLQDETYLDLAKSLAKVDGALHIGADLKLHGFACLLDGQAIPGEDRARGARYNSALRFSARYHQLIVVVVSSDRPVSIIQEGVELSAQCQWKSVPSCATQPPILGDWIDRNTCSLS